MDFQLVQLIPLWICKFVFRNLILFKMEMHIKNPKVLLMIEL